MFVEYFTVFLDLMEVKTKSGSFFSNVVVRQQQQQQHPLLWRAPTQNNLCLFDVAPKNRSSNLGIQIFPSSYSNLFFSSISLDD